jgi:hypothetical protein
MVALAYGYPDRGKNRLSTPYMRRLKKLVNHNYWAAMRDRTGKYMTCSVRVHISRLHLTENIE